MFRIVAATKNDHKLEELKKMIGDIDNCEIVSLNEYPNYPDVEETGTTFEENAALKALAACQYCDVPAFADDSGLCVEALDGAPGVYSARYAPTDPERIAKLLEALKGETNRKAKFVCAISIASMGEVIETFIGEVHGVIIDEPRGNNGFGYDPIFVPEGYDKTFAELSDEEKNKISHRAKAMEAAMEFIDEEMSCLDDF
ncbi:RdgB/HAM1 family non-canonical purine NTP pyrophosphatase [Lentisphaerota bacterium WC36G]|nr:RdgB/HAM1 family non-canonical purine NTP pyrophosphatase [Lentisphaerae bacterium WC36]